MLNLLRTRVSWVWLLLVGATVLSWEMGHGVGLHELAQIRAAVIVVAFIKVRLVILDFMEIRHAPLGVRVVAEAWVLLVCSALLALYLI